MKFHLEMIVRDTFEPWNAVQMQKYLGVQLNNIMKSGKVKDYGIYAEERGGYFIIEANTSEELFELVGPVLDSIHIKTHPCVSVEALGKFFEAQEKMMKQ